MNQLLQEFIDDLNIWLDMGTPEHDVFNTEEGLCSLFISYWITVEASGYWEGKNEMQKMFKSNFPFNKDSNDFREEKNKYENPLRVAFVREHRSKQ